MRSLVPHTDWLVHRAAKLLVVAVSVGAVTLLVATPSDAQRAGPAMLAPPSADASLEAIAEGVGFWVDRRIRDAGIQTLRSGSGSEIFAAARERGATRVIFTHVGSAPGAVEVVFLLHDAETEQLVAASRAAAPLAEVGEACETAGARLLTALGVSRSSISSAAPPLLDELASSGRALGHLQSGELFRAWAEVAQKLSPTAVEVRDAIAATAMEGGASAPERARVLAVSGRPELGWPLIANELERRDLTGADPGALLAAAEVKFEQNNPREARRYLDALLARDPTNADAYLLMSRVLTLRNDRAGASRALEKAIELGDPDPRTLEQLANLAPESKGRATLLLRAARGAVQRLDPHHADRLLGQAAALQPSLQGESWRARGELRERLGLPNEALEAYEAAAGAGAADAAVYRGIGRAQRALGEPAAAEASLRSALELNAKDPETLRELGSLYADGGQPKQAVPLLERAVALQPRNDGARKSLAHALRASGDPNAALEALGSNAADSKSPDSLRELAAIHREKGELEAARYALLRAIENAPHDRGLHLELAEIHRALDDEESAQRELRLGKLLEGVLDAGFDAAALAAAGTSAQPTMTLDEFIDSFTDQHSQRRRVAFLGMRPVQTWQTIALDWLHPRRPDMVLIEYSVESGLRERFHLVDAPEARNALSSRVTPLYDFAADSSLDAAAIASLNQLLRTDAIFVSRFDRMPVLPDDGGTSRCQQPGGFEIEMRMLGGQHPDVVEILANARCLPEGLEAHSVWNARALAIYGVLALLVVYPIGRGWGSLLVTIHVPPHTKGFFSIRLSMSPVEIDDKEKKEKKSDGRMARSLRSLSRFQRRMVGKTTLFSWLPARRGEYFVSVRGPLIDAKTDEIVGHFLEEQTVRIRRGKQQRLEYDFRPTECAVEVHVLKDGQPEERAQIAIAGDPKSLRYAHGGTAYLYLGKGTYDILVGCGDRVISHVLDVVSVEKSIPVWLDIATDSGVVFSDCDAAVAPYLAGDLAVAASALEESGQERLAKQVRGELHRRLGELDEAAANFEEAGLIEQAAELLAQGPAAEQSAELFERAGEHTRAAELYRAAQDFEAAGRCYEAAYDYDDAIECYRSADNSDKVLELLEKVGNYLDAGALCRELGQEDRALSNFGQIALRDGGYFEARSAMAEILGERDELDLAIAALGDAVQSSSEEGIPVDILVQLADLLARAGRTAPELETCEAIQRREPHRAGLTDRISRLREAVAGGNSNAPTATAGTESRYEILAELGRGGMGVVLKARDRELGRLVALKRLPDNLRDHPTAVTLFRREAQAAAGLNHRNIVTVYDAGEENGSYFITMELLEGMPLNAILKRRGRLKSKDVARLGVQICAGLHYAHEQRIVHRDIKTANLFFTQDRTVKIMDFGLAKTIEEVRRNSTVIGGTPYFMAPEQAVGGELDHRADIYALGVTLYQLSTGTVPFQDGDLAYHHQHTPAPDPRERAPDVPDALAALLLEMLAKTPTDRPADAGVVGMRLQALLNG